MDKLIKNISIKLLIIFFYFAPIITNAENLTSTDFEKLKGYEVKFDYKNYEKERKIAKQYFDKVYNDSSVFANINVKYVGIDLFDINDDGKKEIFAYINYGDKCPLAGCPFVILQQQKNGIYTKIPWGEGEEGEAMCNGKIKILSNKTLNYNDLFFYDKNGNHTYIKEWKGTYYDVRDEFLSNQETLN